MTLVNTRPNDSMRATPSAATTVSADDTTCLLKPTSNNEGSPSQPRVIWMLATGTRGDIQPFAAIGLALLRRAQCRVKFFTNQDYVNFVTSFGMEGVALRPSNCDVGHEDTDPTRPLQALINTNSKTAAESADVIRRELAKEKPDLVISSAMLTGIAWYLSVQHNVPHMDLTPVADIEPPKLPFGLERQILGRQVYQIFRPFLRELDPTLEQLIPPSSYCELLQNPNRPILVMQSPTIARIQYAHLTSPMYRYIGTTVIEESDQTRDRGSNSSKDPAASFGGGDESGTMQQLREFLDHPRQPIYMGWGSMKSRSPEHLVELCVRAAQRSGQRAIVLEGDAGLSLDALQRAVSRSDSKNDDNELLEYAKNNVLFVKCAPHEWLFPKVAAIVHHGGAGTTTASFRSGVPSVIAPVLADQFDHSRLVNSLGVGVGLPAQINSLKFQELSDAILRAVNDDNMREKANQLSQQLRSERNGADVAVDEVQKFWTDYWRSGKFHECFPPPRSTSPLLIPLGGTFLLIGGVVLSMVAIAAWNVFGSKFYS